MKGYIAITTSIILSVLILALSVALGSAHLMTRLNAVDYSNKQSSLFIARSCLNYAMLKLADNSLYGGNETINISSYQCTIRTIQTSGLNKIIESRSQVSGATTNLRLTVNATNLSTVSLEELVKF